MPPPNFDFRDGNGILETAVSEDDGSGNHWPVHVIEKINTALPAGTHNIGDVDVVTLPADPLGASADASVAAGATGSISAKLRRVTQGLEDLKTLIVLAAGENHVGQVSGHSTVISVTPTVSATPDYSSGDAVGGKQTLTSAARVSGGTTILQSLFIVDAANVKPQFEILIFDSDPTAATITDNSAFVFSTAISKLIARISVVTADYVSVGGVATADIGGIGKVLKASGSANLYAAVVADAAINLAATDDLRFNYGFMQE